MITSFLKVAGAARTIQVAALPGLALAASLFAAGASQAQSVSVRVDGLSDRAAHAAIVKAAIRVCRDSDYSPLAPISEDVCVADTVAVASRQVAQLRQGRTDLAQAESVRTTVPARR
jgi:hypothetical protein